MNFYEEIVLSRVRRCAGLYLWYGADSELYASLVVAVSKKGKVLVESTYSSNSLDEIIHIIPGHVPLIISLDGGNVIHREVDLASSENPVSQAFPGSSIKDFYIRRHDAGKDKAIISLVRKEDIHRFVQSFNDAGLLVCDLNLGPFSIKNLAGVSTSTNEVVIPFYNLNFENGSLTNFNRSFHNNVENNYSFEFGNENLSSEFLVSVSLCYHFFQTRFEETSDELLTGQRKELVAKKILAVSVLPFLLLIFTALIVNFILLLHFDKENSFLNVSVISGKQQLTQIDSLRKAVVIKQKVLEARHNRGAKYLAFYSDRIASCVHSGIMLTEMKIYPQVSVNQKRDQYTFRDGIISITGLAESTVSLEAFVENLSALRWIESVKIQNYIEEKGGAGSFRLEITISEDQ